MSDSAPALTDEFAAQRSHLIAVAYRLTGSVSDAEDAVQEAWLRLAALPRQRRDEIRDLRAWLTTVVGRIGLDRLRSAAVRRERYVGQWLPEPIVTPLGSTSGEDPLEAAVRDEGVRMAAMVVLDTLSAEQRVAFVLHDAFDVPFAEIAGILGCSPAAARQHASRGRRALADAEPPPRAPLPEQQALLERLVAAMATADVQAIAEVLHPDVVLIGDSDGRARTTRQVMVGADKLVRFFHGLARMYSPEALAKATPVLVNGDLGLYIPASPGYGPYRALDTHVQSLAIRDGRIVAAYDHANPEKLTHVAV
ncbi:sigma-70 family RNA polymerase sigma factor [Amycolatopsis suaedae]|uniref:Sigma-70 family RNA polymerase sigma factor n=1 Tax=Amycolatopsis suaedae TaxID=2510978 RepID=A0A4Q7J173_9PSEU|nr:sigma-70 family RNA polymerase sigma factor [Amycolatopsis suaedae]RZQ60332.1 sigma-70 family RNA polymerase sigma factor [Amycolatopsis suaedae]